MLSRSLLQSEVKDVKQFVAANAEPYQLSDYGYGKDAVKVLHVQRNGPVHSIKEFEVGSHLKLYSKKDYINGFIKFCNFLSSHYY